MPDISQDFATLRFSWPILRTDDSDEVHVGKIAEGSNGSDFLRGTFANDSLNGKDGNDILNGNPTSSDGAIYANQFKQVDTLTGGAGNDSFILGETITNPTGTVFNYPIAYYTGFGLADYALITDFTPSEDTIQLVGSASLYTLGAAPEGFPAGTAIYLGAPESQELVAVLQGVSLSSFDQGFTFINAPQVL